MSPVSIIFRVPSPNTPRASSGIFVNGVYQKDTATASCSQAATVAKGSKPALRHLPRPDSASSIRLGILQQDTQELESCISEGSPWRNSLSAVAFRANSSPVGEGPRN